MINRLKEKREAERLKNPILRDKSFELLLDTVKELKPKRILEVGVNVGLSSIAMLLSCESATLTGLEIDEEAIEEAKRNYKEFGVENRAKIFCGDAWEIIPVLTGEYDFIFLDGPKGHYHEYLPYLLAVLKKGGILFADNVLFRGYVLGEKKVPHRIATIAHAMQKFIAGVTLDPNLQTEIIDIEDGVSITRKLN